MNKEPLLQGPAFSRVAPFATYMLFTLVYDLVKPLIPPGALYDNFTAVVYPVKILAVTALLVFYRKTYNELRPDQLKASHIIPALSIGAIVFILWINMDWDFATLGTPDAYDPGILPGKAWYYAFIAVRLTGAALVVPVFEEIFWRSFVLRYIISQNFTAVKIGTFTWTSFIISSLLFGSEHNLWLAGITAGVFYNLLLYRTRSIPACVIAHGVTNLLLGIYVIRTESWRFW